MYTLYCLSTKPICLCLLIFFVLLSSLFLHLSSETFPAKLILKWTHIAHQILRTKTFPTSVVVSYFYDRRWWWLSANPIAQGQRCSHSFHLFSFYLKTNAENQILQGHIITKRNEKKTFTESSPFHLHPSEPVSIIEPPTHSCVLVCGYVCLCAFWQCVLISRCVHSHSNVSYHNQLLCFRKLVFFFYISVKIWTYFVW